MDYKFIILIFLVVAVVLFIMQKLDGLKKDIEEKTHKIISCVENNSKLIRAKTQAEVSSCIGKMRSINGEYIEQVRKMNDYASQPITNMSNNFSESDSQMEDTNSNNHKHRNIIRHLSDCPEDEMEDSHASRKKGDDKFYESEDDEACARKLSEKFTITYLSDKKPNSDKKSDKKQDLPKVNSPKVNLAQKSVESEDQESEEAENEEENDTKEVDSESSDSGEEYEEYVEEDDENNNSSSEESEEESEDQESSDGANLEMDSSDESELQTSSKSSSKVVSKGSSKGSSKNSSKFGEITFGSSKKGGSKKPTQKVTILKRDIKKQSNKKSSLNSSSKSSSTDSSEEQTEDEKSITTNDMNALTFATFEPISSYNVENLKTIAKRLSIPLTQSKDGKGRKPLKKEELYEKIRSKLNDNETK